MNVLHHRAREIPPVAVASLPRLSLPFPPARASGCFEYIDIKISLDQTALLSSMGGILAQYGPPGFPLVVRCEANAEADNGGK